MFTRRQVLAAGACSLAAPYFYTSTIVRADELTDGLVDNVRVLTSNLSMSPAGRSDGTDRQVAGGGTVYGRTVQEQADVMANAGEFVATYEEAVETTELYSNGTGYTFVRFREGFRNCCLPLGYVANQNGAAFGGAMTLVEGPNLVALRVLTTLLIERNYTESQVSDLCWPVRPSIDAKRERAMIYFKTIPEITDENGQNVYADRDVLHARGAECVVRYTHKPTGEPDGGGEGALIVNGLTEFRFDFRFRPEIFI